MEWKKKRKQFIKGKVCEWCGSSKYLAIHHTDLYLPFRIRCKIIADPILKKLINEGVYQNKTRLGCPNCKTPRFNARKKKLPKYHCNKCGHNFEKPISVDTGRLSKENFEDFKKKYGPKIQEIADSQYQESLKEYLAFKNVIVLCRKCHWATEHGRVLCKKCKKKYHTKRYKMCKKCFLETPAGLSSLRKKGYLIYNHPWCNSFFAYRKEQKLGYDDPEIYCITFCAKTVQEFCEKKEKR